MDEGQLRDLVQRYVAALQSQDPDAIERFHADDSVTESDEAQGKQLGRQQRRQYFQERINAFSNVQVTAKNITVDAKHDRAQFEWTISGTHTGNFQGHPPTNKPVQIDGRTELEFRGDKIVREKSHFQDMGALMKQLG